MPEASTTETKEPSMTATEAFANTLTPTATETSVGIITVTDTPIKIPTQSPSASFGCTKISNAYVDDTKDGNIINIICNDGSKYTLPPLEQGTMIVGPNDKFLVYFSNSGYLYFSKAGEER